jgi:hypothetical protein
MHALGVRCTTSARVDANGHAKLVRAGYAARKGIKPVKAPHKKFSRRARTDRLNDRALIAFWRRCNGMAVAL